MGYPSSIIVVFIAYKFIFLRCFLSVHLPGKMLRHKLIYILFISVLFSSYTVNGQTTLVSNNPATKSFPADLKNGKITYGFVPSIHQTWGFQILVNQKPIIKQLSIPAVQGNLGFKDTTAAGKVARLMILKMKKGEMPPTVTIQELKKINAI